MYNVDVYVEDTNKPVAKLEQLKIKRNWMHESVYNCTPIATANTFGYGVYFDQDLSFIWDGNFEHPAESTRGGDIIWPGRGAGTVSFQTNLIFRTDENTSLLTMPVPNQPIENAIVLSTILSTSFFSSILPIAWKLEKPNKEYFVPAGTYIAAIVPISISQFNQSNINIYNKRPDFDIIHGNKDYIKALKDQQKEKGFLRLYNKGLDHNKNKIGFHESKPLKMNVKNYE
jgi:hypothetical protein